MARHLDRLSRNFGVEKAQAVLEHTTLRLEGSQLRTGRGGDVGPMECTQYLEAVRVVLGDIEYFPTRVNFILARCSCLNQPA